MGRRKTHIMLIDCSRPLDDDIKKEAAASAEEDFQGRDKMYDSHHPPVGILALATYLLQSDLKDSLEVKFIDASVDCFSWNELKESINSFGPDIVGFRCLNWYTELFHRLTQYCKKLSNPPVTVGGGPYVSAAPEFAASKDSNLDFVIDGEGEETFYDTVKAFTEGESIKNVPGVSYVENGKYKKPLVRGVFKEMDSIPFPDWKLLDFDKYKNFMGQAPILRKAAPIFTSRGCPYRCTYCHELFQKQFRKRSAEHIFEELKILDDLGVKDILIIDDIFNLDEKRVIKLFDLVQQHNMDMRFYYPNGLRGDIMSKEVIDAMIEGGSIHFSYALESGSKRIQRFSKKNLRLEAFYDNVEYTIKKGVMVDIFLMVGFPTESYEEMQETLKGLFQFDEICFPYLNTVSIFPGTRMFDWLIENGYRNQENLFENLYGRTQTATDHTAHVADTDMINSIKTQFLMDYFLRRSRLKKVLNIQRKFLTDEEILTKYQMYLPPVKSLDHLLNELSIPDEVNVTT